LIERKKNTMEDIKRQYLLAELNKKIEDCDREMELLHVQCDQVSANKRYLEGQHLVASAVPALADTTTTSRSAELCPHCGTTVPTK
jgi:hypothetical protein